MSMILQLYPKSDVITMVQNHCHHISYILGVMFHHSAFNLWSDELAWIAQAYSQLCQFERSDNVQSPSFSTVAFWLGNCSELHILHC